ncbi:crotonase/enoyl-CoA hydratase family protein [Nocardioides carbamazepini]|uniref:crotonase/enoyl-CoA hydratase family protein n=1 Tax=Nocardioides carbamazepini TaxID=2854259 RepID=UPI00214A6D57|nr:crotonase/enoyl-CoA hydratase family protein [Nocardioides carbamazepini]MCR1783783.1 crotonase/enoyl-CoA hydratase family protein [Nocardioides carbamazepini]
MPPPLHIAREGAVETWTIDVPDAGNAVSGADIVACLESAIDRVNRDVEVGAVILTGAGRLFSSGGNVKEMAERRGVFALSPLDQRHAYVDTIQRIPRAMVRCEVPVIAAVNGPAVGAGCDLAMMCDLRIAASGAFFAESFVQVGLIPGDGGSWFLPRVVGEARAAEMTLTGDRVPAATALEWGMVNAVVAAEELLPAAHALAERITKNPVHSVRMAKRLLQASRTDSLDSVLGLAAALQPLAHGDPEHHERVDAWRRARADRSGA